MSYQQWIVDVWKEYDLEQYLFGLRKGQWLMNQLYQVRPDLYNQVVVKGIDAFYGDSNIPQVLEFLAIAW